MKNKKIEIEINDTVIVKKDSLHIKKGEIGKISYIYYDGNDYEVSFNNDLVVLLNKSEIEKYEK